MKVDITNLCDFCIEKYEESQLIEISIDGRIINKYCQWCWENYVRDAVIKLKKMYEEASAKYASRG